MQFKSCPRCHGDMKTTNDIYGAYKECLQCGYIRDIEDTTRQRKRRFAYELAVKEVA